MKDYIINAPQLQSFSKRISGVGITVICWIMWGYLLFPIITLINWLRGDYNVINEMRWFGGYKSLLELMEIYVGTLIVLGIVWLFWVLMRKLRRKRVLPAAQKVVTDEEISIFYHIDKNQIRHFQNQQNVTVFFDESGKIIALE
jgi:poly-beta-1,6-N-acetyl-D-glucosamine biosynthesis protein PgaD